MADIGHADEIRGAEFRRLLRKPWVLAVIGGLAVAAAGLTAAMWIPLAAVAAFASVVALGLVSVFAFADHRAAEAFFDSYARSRGLTRSRAGVPGLTPLLRRGDSREVNQGFTGRLADGIDGSLLLYTYTEESRDSDGDRTEVDCPFTVVLIEVPEIASRLPELLLQRKSGLKALEKFEDAFRHRHDRVTLESEAMRDRYEIFVTKEQDPIFVRRLFSPSFIVWLTDVPPGKFAFELVGGHLCAFVPKHRESAEGLDEMIAVGTAVAKRLRDEVTG